MSGAPRRPLSIPGGPFMAIADTASGRVAGLDTEATWRSRALAVIGTVVAMLAIWVIARPLAGAALDVRRGSGAAPQAVGPAAVALATGLAGLAGWGLLALLERFTTPARVAWTTTAIVALVLSLAGPLGATTAAAKAVLIAMHLVAAAVLIPTLARTAANG